MERDLQKLIDTGQATPELWAGFRAAYRVIQRQQANKEWSNTGGQN